MTRLLLVLAFIVTLGGCQTVALDGHNQAAVAAIEQVIQSFKIALQTKNKPLYMSLFFSSKAEEIGWQHVSEDTRLVEIRATKPDAIKARRLPANSFISLIDEAVAAKGSREETFDNVRVETDGGACETCRGNDNSAWQRRAKPGGS